MAFYIFGHFKRVTFEYNIKLSNVYIYLLYNIFVKAAIQFGKKVETSNNLSKLYKMFYMNYTITPKSMPVNTIMNSICLLVLGYNDNVDPSGNLH